MPLGDLYSVNCIMFCSHTVSDNVCVRDCAAVLEARAVWRKKGRLSGVCIAQLFLLHVVGTLYPRCFSAHCITSPPQGSTQEH